VDNRSNTIMTLLPHDASRQLRT